MHARFKEVMETQRALQLPREISVSCELCGKHIMIEDYRNPSDPKRLKTLDADEAIARLREIAAELYEWRNLRQQSLDIVCPGDQMEMGL